MMVNETGRFGILIIDTNDIVVYAGGCADSIKIRHKLLEGLDEKRAQGSGMIALELGRQMVVTYRAMADAMVFFIQPVEEKSALFDLITCVDFAHAIFTYLVENPYFSMIVADEQSRLKFIPPVHEKFFGFKRGEGIGKHVTEVIENTRLHEVVQSGRAEIGKLQEMGGVTRVVSRIPITQNGKTVGAIGQVMFKEPETVHNLSREVTKLRSEVQFYRQEMSGMKKSSFDLEQMVGDSEAMRQLKSDIIKVAPLHVPVLIVGESGTGKELAAHAIHALSLRSKNRMIFVNAAALPGGLVESELFGYESGAFTGAEKAGRKGKFELADNSSLFFDEVGDMPAEIQVKLLRVLQDGMFERVGGNRVFHSDFRLICASNCNFQEMIGNGQFRLDLYYRISGVTIRMPSLRERLEDVPELVQSILVSFANRHRTSVKRVDGRVYDFLREQSWPGNVRQLLHEVEKAAIFCDGPEITIENFRLMSDIPLERASSSEAPVPVNASNGTAAPSSTRTIQDAINELEKNMIREAMSRHRGNKKKAAEELGISRAYLYKKLDPE
ncbi:sigma-54 interaction domain-containing protein [Noviherbaspirillum sp. Root189]|uniref:sigma-54 interaction domain-containing protein n=1 Tax=Noviherbaspirillum sp. Root189 TaxID=1736487 RepID=UPI00070FC238|nr:sigma 54-interacting transcriptional regulator [Noviherbaspirillum sp. Root189]KRB81571.1 Fis family transcriptional regulator [Noviherbaspirillum sp. Root189]